MLHTFPPIGTRLTFRDGRKKPVEGVVVAHVPAEDGWEAGIRTFWPTLSYRKTKGVHVFNQIPAASYEIAAEKPARLRAVRPSPCDETAHFRAVAS